MKNILKKGHGIIITGDQDTGKSLLANVIAKSLGFYATADFKAIISPFNSILRVGAEVIIIEEFNPTSENLAIATALVAGEKTTIKHQGYEVDEVESPCFIFVTNVAKSVKLAEVDRRFTVISIKG